MSTRTKPKNRLVWTSSNLWYLALLCAGFVSSSGCSWDQLNVFAKPPAPPPPPAESMILHGDRLETEIPPAEGSNLEQLAGAQELYRRGEYVEAQKLFHEIAQNKKNTPAIAEEARFYEAECLRYQKEYPKAADTYNRLLNDFPSSVHKDQAIQRMFEIANYWLDDTRNEMRALKKQEKKGWFDWPTFLHFEKTKPLLDEEGRAFEKLEQVQYQNIDGPLGEQALFWMGSIKFFREDYKEADYYFSQLVDHHPNSPYVAKATELAIVSKHLSTGGYKYDGRKTVEARKLVLTAMSSYPELAGPKREFLENQIAGINKQQAEKDFSIAEFYRRTGHPGSAYFYYEIVRRRYPGTDFYAKATKRMSEIKIEQAHQGNSLVSSLLTESMSPTPVRDLLHLSPPPAKAAPTHLPEQSPAPTLAQPQANLPEQAPPPNRIPPPVGTPAP